MFSYHKTTSYEFVLHQIVLPNRLKQANRIRTKEILLYLLEII